MTRRRAASATTSAVVGTLLAAGILAPVAWGVMLSFKTRVDALAIPPTWFFAPTLANYRAAFIDGQYAGALANSLIIAVASSALAMTVGLPAAYALSRAQFKGRSSAFLGLMTVRMAPATVVALPLFVILTQLGLVDSYVGVVLVHAGVAVPIAVWLMKGVLDEIPVEVDEASLLDGDTRISALVRQVVPACTRGLLTAAAFCFVNSWNEFFLALMLTGYDTRPLTVAIPALVTPHGTYWGEVTAISTVALMPGVVLALAIYMTFVRDTVT